MTTDEHIGTREEESQANQECESGAENSSPVACESVATEPQPPVQAVRLEGQQPEPSTQTATQEVPAQVAQQEAKQRDLPTNNTQETTRFAGPKDPLVLSKSFENEQPSSEGSLGESQPDGSSGSKEMGWYVVHAYSGFELKAKQSLEERIRHSNLESLFGEVHVPQETVVELVRGQKKTSNKKFFPGYILVQMVLNEDTWHLVKDTPKVTGFLGDATNPEPLKEEEVVKITEQEEEGATSPRSRVSFEEGETVKVVGGPFADFTGTVEEVKPDKGKVKVLISIFGRATPVELDFIQVERS